VREVRVRLPKPRDEVRLKPEFLAIVQEVAGVLAATGSAQKTEDNI
jgi:hypothetical protein